MKNILLASLAFVFFLPAIVAAKTDDFFGFKKTIKSGKNKLEEYVVGRLEYPLLKNENIFIVWYKDAEVGVGAKITDKTEILRIDEGDGGKKITKEDFARLSGAMVAAYIKSEISEEKSGYLRNRHSEHGDLSNYCVATKIQFIVLPAP